MCGDGLGVVAGDAAVEAADDLRWSAQQLLAESAGIDAQVGLVDVVDAAGRCSAPGVVDDRCLRWSAASASPLASAGGVVVEGELLDLLQRSSAGRLLEVGGELLVVPGGGGVGGQEQRVGQVVAVGRTRSSGS